MNRHLGWTSWSFLPAGAIAIALCATVATADTPDDWESLNVPPARQITEQDDTSSERMVQLDFDDAELADVIDTIAKMTKTNFIYDDRVRGRVTIVSPTPIPIEQAYAVFESVLQVKGFTTVETPGGALKVIPVRDAKESSVETIRSSRPPPNRDLYVTRLIPLQYVDAEPIVNTLKPLVSKDAAIAAYVPTNTIILTESASNIRRILAILDAIDVDTYKEEIAVIKVENADATTLGQQITDIFEGGDAPTQPRRRRTSTRRTAGQAQAQAASSGGGKPGGVRILTDDRTNSIIVLAARAQIDEVRTLVARLDVPAEGGGQIQVYYLQHADAEETAQTLSSLVGGRSAPIGGGGGAGETQAQALRATVSGLAGGINVTADPATNSLIIQASRQGYDTILDVIMKLDVPRPQVLVEALIMEVDVTDSEDLGFNGIYSFVSEDFQFTIEQLSDAATRGALAGAGLGELSSAVSDPNKALLGGFRASNGNSTIQGVIRASAADAGTNIISAPHILTSDNEEAEIRIGNNIPIITSRVESAAGQTIGLSSSVNVERQDIGITLRVTPQITEGDMLRLDIFQELTDVNEALSATTGDPQSVGVSLLNRRIENTVVVKDADTVVIGGLISDVFTDSVNKVPFFGDIPILGWAFKTTSRELRKINLLVFLTPHIVRSSEELELATIKKRHEFREKTGEALNYSKRELEHEEQKRAEADAAGVPYVPGPSRNPVRMAVLEHEVRYPLERMYEIEQQEAEAEEAERAAREAALRAPGFVVQAPVAGDELAATNLLMDLIDGGYDGTLVTTESAGLVLYEVRIGPYRTLEKAQEAGEVVQRSFGLVPAILVLPPETP